MKHDKDGIRVVQKGAGNNRRIRAAAKKCECDEAMKQRTTDASFVAASTCEQWRCSNAVYQNTNRFCYQLIIINCFLNSFDAVVADVFGFLMLLLFDRSAPRHWAHCWAWMGAWGQQGDKLCNLALLLQSNQSLWYNTHPPIHVTTHCCNVALLQCEATLFPSAQSLWRPCSRAPMPTSWAPSTSHMLKGIRGIECKSHLRKHMKSLHNIWAIAYHMSQSFV